MKIPSVTKLSRKCNSDTVLLLLRCWNEIRKVVAALGKSRFVAGNTLLKQYTPPLWKTVKAAVAPVCCFFLWGRVSIPPASEKPDTGRKSAEKQGVNRPKKQDWR